MRYVRNTRSLQLELDAKMIKLQMYTGMVPFHDSNAAVEAVLKKSLKWPTGLIQGLDDDMRGYIETMWSLDPTDRPTAAETCRRISFKMRSEGKDTVRPSPEVEWDVGFLANAAVTMAAEDPFALAHT